MSLKQGKIIAIDQWLEATEIKTIQSGEEPFFLTKVKKSLTQWELWFLLWWGWWKWRGGRRVSLIQLDGRLVPGLRLSQQSIFIFLMFPGFTSQRQVTWAPIPGALSSSHLLGATVTLYEIPQGSLQRPLQCLHLSAGLPSLSTVCMSIV